MVNGARVIGPAVAGLLLSVFGAGYCFLLNAVSYVAVVGALFAMEIKAEKRVAPPGRFLRELADGLRYTFRFTPIRDILLLLALVSLTGSSYTVLLPIFAGEVLHRGSGLYALLFAGAGVGALAAAGLLAMRKSAQGLGFWIAGAPVIFGVGLIVLGASPWVWLSLAIMPVIGFGLLAQTASSNTVLQTLVDDGMRGRVMSLYSMAFMGMIPLGSLLAGVLARQWGAPIAVMINGACCIMGALCFHRRLSRRTSYPPILC
jgi:MFS family permease